MNLYSLYTIVLRRIFDLNNFENINLALICLHGLGQNIYKMHMYICIYIVNQFALFIILHYSFCQN